MNNEGSVVCRPNLFLISSCRVFFREKRIFKQYVFEQPPPYDTLEGIQGKQRLCIALRDCCHVEYVGETFITLHMTKDRVVTLKPDNYQVWYEWIPKWISYFRQVPLWQILIESGSCTPMSWGWKQQVGKKWERVFLRYHANERELRIWTDEAAKAKFVGVVDLKRYD